MFVSNILSTKHEDRPDLCQIFFFIFRLALNKAKIFEHCELGVWLVVGDEKYTNRKLFVKVFKWYSCSLQLRQRELKKRISLIHAFLSSFVTDVNMTWCFLFIIHACMFIYFFIKFGGTNGAKICIK